MDGYGGDEVFDQADEILYTEASEDDDQNTVLNIDNDRKEIKKSNDNNEFYNFDDNETTSTEYTEEEENQTNWNEKFQNLVEKTYFRIGENNYSAERQYDLSIQLKQLCAEFAEEAAEIGIQIVKERVF